jgi:tetratricopeptide (TPR) repeat protein
MNFLQFAVWGAYLTSMSRYLGPAGMGSHIGIFYSVQGIVSIFMPALIGIIADRWVPAQKLLGICHILAAIFMISAGLYGLNSGTGVEFGYFFTLYTLSVAFYMPTLALSNSVAYTILERAGFDTVKAFPPIRVFGTVGFICSMWLVDILGYQTSSMQFIVSAVLGIVLGLYAFTLPNYPDKPELLFEMANAYADNGELEKAISQLDELEKSVGVSESLALNKFRLYSMLDNKEKAFQEIEQIINKNPDDIRYLILMGDLYMDDNQVDNALNYYDQAKLIDPDYPALILSFVNYYEKTNDRDAARITCSYPAGFSGF